jgi:hypothetical protein
MDRRERWNLSKSHTAAQEDKGGKGGFVGGFAPFFLTLRHSGTEEERTHEKSTATSRVDE